MFVLCIFAYNKCLYMYMYVSLNSFNVVLSAAMVV